MVFQVLLAILFLFPTIALPQEFTYDDLRDANGFCYPGNGCEDDQGLRWCYCDDLCEDFGDCCHDKIVKEEPQGKTRCLDLEGEGAYVIVQCKSAWSGHRLLREKCREPGSWDDPLSMVPTTSKSSGLTYKNYYCAICNDDQTNATLWNVFLATEDGQALEGTVNGSELLRHLSFNDGHWGIRVPSPSSEETLFSPIIIYSKKPASVTIRTCDARLVSSCLPHWKDQEIQRRCRQYTSPIYTSQMGFKNVHCAMCNGINPLDLSCKTILTQTPPIVEEDIHDMVSFSVLLDMNYPEDSQDSEEDSCPENSIWDPIFKLCRYIECGVEDYKLEDGECRPITKNLSNKDFIKLLPTESISLKNGNSDNDDLLGRFSERLKECLKIPIYDDEYTMFHNKTLKVKKTGILLSDSSYVLIGQTAYVCLDDMIEEGTALVSSANYSSIFRNCKKMYFFPEDYKMVENDGVYIIPHDDVYLRNEYIIIGNKLYICDPAEYYNYEDDESDLGPPYDPQFLACQKIILDQGEYIIYPNGTAYIPKYERYFNSSWYINNSDGLIICFEEESAEMIDEEDNKRSRPFEGIITSIGISISIFFIVLHLISFCFVSEMRNLPGLNLASLCLALLFGYSTFFMINHAASESKSCIAIAIVIQYSFLASFFWMNIISFDVWRSLYVATTSLRVSGRQNKWKRFLIYSSYSWLSPLALIALSVGVEFSSGVQDSMKPFYGKPICWINNRTALFFFFGLPLVILLLANIIFFVYSSIIILTSAWKSKKDVSSPPRRNFRLYIRLAIMMGLTWITGILATATNLRFIWVIFVIFNTLQGLLIFLGFTFSNSRVRRICKNTFKSTFRMSTSIATDQSTVPSTMMTTRY